MPFLTTFRSRLLLHLNAARNSDTVPCGQCLDYDGSLATCSVDRGLVVDSNVGWTTIHFKSKSKSRRGKSKDN
jgi:hypothetical protein